MLYGKFDILEKILIKPWIEGKMGFDIDLFNSWFLLPLFAGMVVAYSYLWSILFPYLSPKGELDLLYTFISPFIEVIRIIFALIIGILLGAVGITLKNFLGDSYSHYGK